MKILVTRLSSIGDVVLTTPVLRCLKTQIEVCKLHLISKKICCQLLQGNPYIDRIIEYDGGKDQESMLREEHYDYIVDLHNNHRTRRLRRQLHVRSLVYRKENFGKFMLVLTKWDIMSGRHVVDRYFDAVKSLGVTNDSKGLELSNFPLNHLNTQTFKHSNIVGRADGTPQTLNHSYVVIACGAQHETKRIPPEKIAYLANGIEKSVVLVGDNSDRQRMERVELGDNVLNLCGMTSLQESAAIVSKADAVVTSDSAMMHVAAAYHRKVIAIWGCTSPRFGFWAYGTEHIDVVPQSLRCWPCRRMGTNRCPKGHFNCMINHDYDEINKIVLGIKNGS
ncbi:MAG: glycosyltransferase family 9 protein [Bacteroidales bacterium]|nr:glycosyltransferase family 9 protein [Bacteroidales bacterium]